ncbi:hypothetical protein HYPSUDRAFT_288912 [Hypholoma sublateritium FD-334 SS-4]|uniref:F-box domain-containing protein n=1 Tax=Hypholoma sublateritium (strain FD-334 SS-4) TaxID=945553 RepID=A0A0D2NBL7_HYPSF|nr:hypothetical protein HYPSUDRAFT_288912 [Hypholoma sublateritium FD-334 SS-4]
MRGHSIPALPQFTTLMQNNDAPSPEERRFLLDALSAPEMALKAMRMEISQLTARLQALVDEERQLTEKVGPYRAVLSPFRALPDDILREIFLACIPTDTNPLVDPRHAPILLTHISRHTRHIALTTARLWVAIHVSIERCENRIGRQIEAVTEWINRSGICELSLSVHEDVDSSTSPPHNTDELLKILTESSARWKKISYIGSFASLQRVFPPIHESSEYPRLESCSIKVTSKPGRKRDPQAVFNSSALVTAPHLSDLSLLTSSSAGNYSAYSVRWDRITHLSLGSSTSAVKLGCASTILRFASQLRSCTLHVKDYEPLPPISFPHLTSISLAIAPDEWWLNTPQARALFAEMYLPSLRCITYDAANGIMPLLGLLCGAEGRIRHLSVANLSGPLQLFESLQYCPRLISLDVHALGPALAPPENKTLQTENTTLQGWFELFQPSLIPLAVGLTERQSPPPRRLCPEVEHLFINDGDKSISVFDIAPLLKVVSNCADRLITGGRLG